MLKCLISSALVFLAMKIKKSIQSMHQKDVVKKKKLINYCWEKNERDTMFLLKIQIYSCMIILYIVEENIFVVIIYKLLVQKKH